VSVDLTNGHCSGVRNLLKKHKQADI